MLRFLRRVTQEAAALKPSPENDLSTPVPLTPEQIVLATMSTDRALWRILNRGLNIGTVIDVGASNGMWSAVCEKRFPDANYLLIEAQKLHEPALKVYCGARPKAEYILAAAGDSIGEIFFNDDDPFGGAASKEQFTPPRAVLPMTTVDSEVVERGLPGPYLIKLDTHGFEVPILEGAKHTLEDCNLAVIEAYNFRIADQALLFHEMVAYMREGGFSVVDMSEPLWREKDSVLWQFDLFFQRSDAPELANQSYQ